MKIAIETSLDAAGRLVVPKAIREQAGLEPGMPLTIRWREGKIEIEPTPRRVRVVAKGSLRIASPEEASVPLAAEVVERTRRSLRERPE